MGQLNLKKTSSFSTPGTDEIGLAFRSSDEALVRVNSDASVDEITGWETLTTLLEKLGDGSTISSTYLPSSVDEIIEVADYASLPATGASGKIYVTLDTSYIYRWGSTVYVQITNPLSFCSEAEAQAGTNETKEMNPLRTLQSFIYQAANYSFSALNTTSKYIIGAINELFTSLAGKQATLVSGSNIKTINSTSLLGSGNIDISGGGGLTSVAVNSDTLEGDGTSGSPLNVIDKIYTPSTQPVIATGTPNTLTLDVNDKYQAVFEPRLSTGTLSINVDFTLALSKSSNAQIIGFTLSLTGTRIITFPSGVLAADIPSAYTWSSLALTIPAGTDEIYEFSINKYGSNWLLRVGGVNT